MAAAANSLRLRIIETAQISPPAGSVPETSIPLAFSDVVWLNSSPVHRLFLYSYPINSASQFASSCLPALKSSLSITLQSFFPFAGNTRLTPASVDRYEIHYMEGDSVTFIAAEAADINHNEVFGDGPREISKLRALVPNLSKKESDGLLPVFAIQATVFPYHGVAIGITVHHTLCDGNGSVNFMRAWSKICRARMNSTEIQAPAPAPPMLDRSIIPDKDGSVYAALSKNLFTTKDFTIDPPSESEVAYLTSFTLKQEHIRFLKDKFMREEEIRKVVGARCSTMAVTYAFVWVGYLKAKPPTIMTQVEEAHCLFAADHRQRVQPAIPDNYLGNCLGPCHVHASIKDLLGPNGFFEACHAMVKAFEEVKKVGISNAKEWMKISLEVGVKRPLLSAAGSPRFKVYDVDFGWGKPVKVDIVSIAYSGAFAVAESREEQGAGVEIGLPLTQPELDVFKTYYSQFDMK